MPMNKNYYNEDDQRYAKVIESLKSLPHIDAPPDFEMNLKRKINNLTYSEKSEKKPFFFFRKSFIPAAALAFSVFIIFFVFFSPKSTPDNPFMSDPELKAEYSSTQHTVSMKDLLIDPINITSNDVVLRKNVPIPAPEPNRKSEKARENYTGFARTSNEPNLEDFLGANQGQNVDRSLHAKPQLHGEQYSPSKYVSFDGFNLGAEDNDRMLYELKARMDSLKRRMRDNR